MSEVGKIAVLRANRVGDLIFALPALEALRARFPAAEIVLLGGRWHVDFLRDRPGPVDRVIAVPPSRGVGNGDWEDVDDPAQLEPFFAAMQAERFDLALQMHGGGRWSNPFLLRLGARTTVGMRTPDAPPLDHSIPYLYWQNEVLRYLEVVSLVGARTDRLEPTLAVTERDLAEATRVVPDDGRPLVVLHPGASDPRRHWPPERFAAVGDALAGRGARVLVTGTGGERQVVDAVVAAMRAPVEPLVDAMSLNALAGLLSRARVVVSNDSGPYHLAGAVGSTTVGIFWIGNMINGGPVTRARHRAAVSWRLDCPVCGTSSVHGSCSHSDSFVTDVAVDDVVREALELYDAETARAAGGPPGRAAD